MFERVRHTERGVETHRSETRRRAIPSLPRVHRDAALELNTEVNDCMLVTHMANGEEAALGAFYDRWHPHVHSLVRSVARTPGDVEDVMSDIFFQAWQQASWYDAKLCSVQSWILTLARIRTVELARNSR